MELAQNSMMESKYNENYTYTETTGMGGSQSQESVYSLPHVYKWCLTNSFTLEYTVYYMFLDKDSTNVSEVSKSIQKNTYEFISPSIPFTIVYCSTTYKYYLLTKERKYIETIDYLIDTFKGYNKPYKSLVVINNVLLHNPYFAPDLRYNLTNIDVNLCEHLYPHLRSFTMIKHDAFSDDSEQPLYDVVRLKPIIPEPRKNINGDALEYVLKYEAPRCIQYMYITKEVLNRYI